jgi:pimeloyl-ACP methyl ester carboxylesterase
MRALPTSPDSWAGRGGTGLSDPVERLPTLEERMDDVLAVMGAAASKRAYLFGISESGPMCVLFGATYPERTAGLILCNTFARFVWAPDYPCGISNRRDGMISRSWSRLDGAPG